MKEHQELLKKVQFLEREVGLLKEENEVLTDRAEDFLLFGIISEKIGLAKTIKEVIEVTLESISSLKDIHYASCLKANSESVEVISDYAPTLTSSFAGQSFIVNEEILSATREDDYLFECHPDSLPPFIPASLKDKKPKGFALIPISAEEKKNDAYLFLFVFFLQEMDEVQSILPLLCRGIEGACAKIESINLLHKLDTLNKTLAEKVNLQAKEHIKTSALLTSLIDSIPDLIFYKNSESVYLGCNNAFCKFIGRSKDQIIGFTDYDLFDRELADFFREKDRQVLEKRLPVRHDEWVTSPDGSKVLLDTLKTPYYGPENEILGLIGVSRDITEKMKIEEALSKAKKIESIGVLAGGIAHDFNNILAAILGNINLALFDEDIKGRTKELLLEAEKASFRAKDLTQQLLTFSKGGNPVKETTSLETIIKESASFVLHGNKVACEYTIPEHLWLADIDKGQISQVIQNMVINASHAMPEGGIIKILCENVSSFDKYIFSADKGGKYIKISIQDSGVGIPEKLLDRIFDPYFSTKQDGSGLGLAICQSIISKHNGYIFVESVPGEGTTFTIYLPASAKTKTHEKATAGGQNLYSPVKILIMDDEEMVRNVAKAMLTKLGNTVVLAADGVEAVKCYQQAMNSDNPIQLLIMDLTIPGGMGGKEAVQEIHKLNPEAKVIVSSGYSNDPVMANFKKYGFCAAIPKPFQFKDLSRVLSQVLA